MRVARYHAARGAPAAAGGTVGTVCIVDDRGGSGPAVPGAPARRPLNRPGGSRPGSVPGSVVPRDADPGFWRIGRPRGLRPRPRTPSEGAGAHAVDEARRVPVRRGEATPARSPRQFTTPIITNHGARRAAGPGGALR